MRLETEPPDAGEVHDGDDTGRIGEGRESIGPSQLGQHAPGDGPDQRAELTTPGGVEKEGTPKTAGPVRDIAFVGRGPARPCDGRDAVLCVRTACPEPDPERCLAGRSESGTTGDTGDFTGRGAERGVIPAGDSRGQA